jgi:hypothetical protein
VSLDPLPSSNSITHWEPAGQPVSGTSTNPAVGPGRGRGPFASAITCCFRVV